MPVSNLTLMKIAAIGGFATAAMGYALRFKLNNQVAATEYYQDALKTLKSHQGAIYLIGKPILVGRINVSDTENNWNDNLSAQYQVPVKGSKQKGILHFWAHRNTENDNWNVNRIELELKDEPDRRLLVKNEEV